MYIFLNEKNQVTEENVLIKNGMPCALGFIVLIVITTSCYFYPQYKNNYFIIQSFICTRGHLRLYPQAIPHSFQMMLLNSLHFSMGYNLVTSLNIENAEFRKNLVKGVFPTVPASSSFTTGQSAVILTIL